MRLLKNNLEQLAEASNGFSQKPIDITFPQLPQDNRMRLVPRETENEKQIMYKDGDKMHIPGVLDYIGAKYPFKKKKSLKVKSGIKIKKKNRGKFTEYCGGNVTQECINRAKKSGNKTLIKRATFADNARKWKK